MKKLLLCLLLGLFITKTQGESFLEVYQRGVTRYQEKFANDQEKIAIQARQLKERLLTYSPERLEELGLESSSSLSFMDAYRQLRIIHSSKEPADIKQGLLQYNNPDEIIEAGGIEAIKETDLYKAFPQLRQAFGSGTVLFSQDNPGSREELERVLQAVKGVQLAPLKESENWVGAPQQYDESVIYSEEEVREQDVLKPYIQKIKVPAGKEVIFFGDIHADGISFFNALDKLKELQKLKDNFSIGDRYMVFMGDRPDRGDYNLEVLYTVWRLKLANPDRVFLGRGNHETREPQTRYGFFLQLIERFQAQGKQIFESINKLLDLQAVAHLVGTGNDYVMSMHGGLHPMKPEDLAGVSAPIVSETVFHELLGDGGAQKFIVVPGKWNDPGDLGFLWSDFDIQHAPYGDYKVTQIEKSRRGAGWVFPNKETREYLKAYTEGKPFKIHKIIRGHDHGVAGPKGAADVFNDGLVYCHISTNFRGVPQYKDYFNFFNDSSFMILTTAAGFANWRLVHYRDNEVIKLFGPEPGQEGAAAEPPPAKQPDPYKFGKMGAYLEKPEDKGYIKNTAPMLRVFPKDAKVLVPRRVRPPEIDHYHFAKATGNGNEFLVQGYIGKIKKKIKQNDIYFHPAWVDKKPDGPFVYKEPQGFDRGQ